jgi:hypothetical protein
MLRAMLLSLPLLMSANLFAVNLDQTVYGNSSYGFSQKSDDIQNARKINSSVNFNGGLYVGQTGTYTMGNSGTGTLKITNVVNLATADFIPDDIYRIEDYYYATGFRLEGCETGVLADWTPPNAPKPSGRLAWCVLYSGDNFSREFKGVFWMSLQSPEIDGFWNGTLRN